MKKLYNDKMMDRIRRFDVHRIENTFGMAFLVNFDASFTNHAFDWPATAFFYSDRAFFWSEKPSFVLFGIKKHTFLASNEKLVWKKSG